jgi:hypothetical protein
LAPEIRLFPPPETAWLEICSAVFSPGFRNYSKTDFGAFFRGAETGRLLSGGIRSDEKGEAFRLSLLYFLYAPAAFKGCRLPHACGAQLHPGLLRGTEAAM